MELQDYFEFDDCDRIRVKGTRIGIEYILEYFLGGVSPEQTLINYPTLTLEQIYATITYYLHHRGEVGAYMERNRASNEAAYQDYLREEPPPVVKRLRALRKKGPESSRSPA